MSLSLLTGNSTDTLCFQSNVGVRALLPLGAGLNPPDRQSPLNEGTVVVNPSSSLGAAVDLTNPPDSLGKVLY